MRGRIVGRDRMAPLFPAPRCADEVLAVPADRRRGREEWVDRQVADEAARVPAWVDIEALEHVSFLPPAEKAEDRERDREQQNRPPSDDERVSEREQDDSGKEEEHQPDVEKRDEVVNARNQLREDTRLLWRRMHAESLEHAARPARALREQPAELLRH